MTILINMIVGLYLFKKVHEMTFFSSPTVNQVSVQGTVPELQKHYGEKELGNTTFAI
jgi:hypothetical protein